MKPGKCGTDTKRSSSKRGPVRRKKAPQKWTAAELEKFADIIAPHLGCYIDAAEPLLWCHWWNEMEEGAEKKRLEAFLFPDGSLRDDLGSKKVKKALKQMCRESLELTNVIAQEFIEGMQREIRKARRCK